MLQQGRSVHVVVLAPVGEYAANLRARQRLIILVLPSHGQWRQMPVVASRSSGTVGVGFLMAGRAVQSGDASTFWASDYVGKVSMPIVALLWVIRCRVAVDAALMRQYRIDLLPCGEAIAASGNGRRGFTLVGLRG